MRTPGSTSVSARNAVALVFALNGFCFASLFSRVPDLRNGLGLGNSALGLLLLAGALGSVLALPAAGTLIRRTSAGAVVRAAGVAVAVGLPVAALGATLLDSVLVTAVGLFVYGVGVGVWDVAMNVEGAAVEVRLGRAILPRFHAGFSLGSVAGAGVAVAVTAAGVPLLAHYGGAGLAALAVLGATRAFLPVEPERHVAPARNAWLEPRTLAVGLMVLAFALAEGSANDWLALALIDGHDAPPWVGTAGFAAFVTAMTVGRVAGTSLLDRYGRVSVLRATAVLALVGLLMFVLGPNPVVVGVGVVLWGLGASLGFPVGMSAGADDPVRAAARVSVVSTIGYVAFLAGPPVLGLVGDRVGTLRSLLVVVVLLVPTVLLVSVARVPAPIEPS